MAFAPEWRQAAVEQLSTQDEPKVESDSRHNFITKRKHFGYAKANRLLRPTEFKRVFNGNEITIKTRYFIVLIKQKNQAEAAASAMRMGVVVSKKVSKRAVDRNRIKRLVRERFRLQLPELSGQLPISVDVVFIARPLTKLATNVELQQQIDEAWRRVSKTVKNTFNQSV